MVSTAETLKIAEVRKTVDRLNSTAHNADQLMQGIVGVLSAELLKYNWVGFYMLEPGADPPMLVLGHYKGAMTPHVRIPLNQGICGAAAASGKTVVVDDFCAGQSCRRTRYRQPLSRRVYVQRPRVG